MLALHPSTLKAINKPTPSPIVPLMLFFCFTLPLYVSSIEHRWQLLRYLLREMFLSTQSFPLCTVVSYVLTRFHETVCFVV